MAAEGNPREHAGCQGAETLEATDNSATLMEADGSAMLSVEPTAEAVAPNSDGVAGGEGLKPKAEEAQEEAVDGEPPKDRDGDGSPPPAVAAIAESIAEEVAPLKSPVGGNVQAEGDTECDLIGEQGEDETVIKEEEPPEAEKPCLEAGVPVSMQGMAAKEESPAVALTSDDVKEEDHDPHRWQPSRKLETVFEQDAAKEEDEEIKVNEDCNMGKEEEGEIKEELKEEKMDEELKEEKLEEEVKEQNMEEEEEEKLTKVQQADKEEVKEQRVEKEEVKQPQVEKEEVKEQVVEKEEVKEQKMDEEEVKVQQMDEEEVKEQQMDEKEVKEQQMDEREVKEQEEEAKEEKLDEDVMVKEEEDMKFKEEGESNVTVKLEQEKLEKTIEELEKRMEEEDGKKEQEAAEQEKIKEQDVEVKEEKADEGGGTMEGMRRDEELPDRSWAAEGVIASYHMELPLAKAENYGRPVDAEPETATTTFSSGGIRPGMTICRVSSATVTLDRSRQGITDDGILDLDLPAMGSSFREVNFSMNELTAAGLKSVIQLCLQCPELRVLKLYRNRIGDDGTEDLESLLYCCQALSEVHLSHNCFTPKGVTSLVEAALGARSPSSSPLWLRLENNRVPNQPALLAELSERWPVCPRRPGCTLTSCAFACALHLPFLDPKAEGLATYKDNKSRGHYDSWQYPSYQYHSIGDENGRSGAAQAAATSTGATAPVGAAPSATSVILKPAALKQAEAAAKAHIAAVEARRLSRSLRTRGRRPDGKDDHHHHHHHHHDEDLRDRRSRSRRPRALEDRDRREVRHHSRDRRHSRSRHGQRHDRERRDRSRRREPECLALKDREEDDREDRERLRRQQQHDDEKERARRQRQREKEEEEERERERARRRRQRERELEEEEEKEHQRRRRQREQEEEEERERQRRKQREEQKERLRRQQARLEEELAEQRRRHKEEVEKERARRRKKQEQLLRGEEEEKERERMRRRQKQEQEERENELRKRRKERGRDEEKGRGKAKKDSEAKRRKHSDSRSREDNIACGNGDDALQSTDALKMRLARLLAK